jgi:hypothetical protein
MAAKKNSEEQTEDTGGDATSPLIETIDPRQVEANNLTSTPDGDTDAREGRDVPDPKDNPAGPNDVSNTVDPADPMTLTGEDAQPGNNGQ